MQQELGDIHSHAAALALRIRDFTQGGWVAGTTLKEVLDGVSLSEATTPLHQANTIAQLTFHIRYYFLGVLEVLRGGELTIRDIHSFNMEAVETEAQWDALRQSLYLAIEDFAKAVEALDASMLDAPFVKPAYGDYRRNINVVIEHAHYHMGQVRLIKKMLKDADDR